MESSSYNIAELAQTLFEESGDALFLFDPETEQILETNPMAERLSGKTHSEILQFPVSYHFRSEQQGGLHRFRQACRKTGPFHSQEGFFLRHRQGWIPVNLTISRLHAEPKTLGLVTARDITERRDAEQRLERKEQELRRVLSSVTASIWSLQFDSEERCIGGYCSPVVEDITGWPLDYFENSHEVWLSIVHPEYREDVSVAFARLRSGQTQHEECEYPIRRKDGSTAWVHDSILARRDPASSGLRLDGVLTDITDRKQSEVLLHGRRVALEMIARGENLNRILEQIAKTIEDQSPGHLASIMLLDRDGKRLLSSAAPSLSPEYMQAIHGIEIGPSVGSCGAAAYHRMQVEIEDIQTHPNWEGFRELAEKYQIRASWSIPILSPDNQVLGTFAVYSPEPYQPTEQDFHLLYLSASLAAIAIERQQANEALQSSHDRYQQILLHTDDLVSVVDQEGRIRSQSASSNRFFGEADANSRIGSSYFDLVHPEDKRQARELFRSIAQLPGSVETTSFRLIRIDGSPRWTETIGQNYINDPLFKGIVLRSRDITVQIQAEQALRTSEKRYRLLFEQNPAGIITLAAEEGIILDTNDSFARMLGFQSSKEVVGRSILEFYFEPPNRPAFLKRLRETGFIYHYEFCFKSRNGSPVWTLSHVALLEEEKGKEVIQSILLDITEWREAQETIRVNEAKSRTLLENLEQGVFFKDSELKFVAANRRFCQALGLPEEAILGRTDAELFPSELADKYRRDDLRVIQDGEKLELEEETLIDNELRYVRVAKSPLRNEHGSIVGVLGIYWDITDQKQLESQLAQAARMEALGQLAGGVAHDFNNLLTIILGNLALLASPSELKEEPEVLVREAETAGLRAAELTHQLLSFSRRAPSAPQVVAINQIVEEVVAIARRTFDPRIKVDLRLEPRLWHVEADPGLIHQALLNLCINARDALTQGGELQISTCNQSIGTVPRAAFPGTKPGEYVCVLVKDNGIGMDPSVQAHIFEPFFTTKGEENGTGLGLSQVFGIIQQHQGWIEVESEPGRGTSFSIYLHRSSAEHPTMESPAQTKEKASREAPGQGTVLIVDDEPMLRNLARMILEKQGYSVILAEDGAEALEIFEARQQLIDLVILDMTMPGLSGIDAMREMRRLKPGARVILSSGFSSEGIAPEDQKRTCGFIPKPYHPDDLVQHVRTALTKEPNPSPDPHAPNATAAQ